MYLMVNVTLVKLMLEWFLAKCVLSGNIPPGTWSHNRDLHSEVVGNWKLSAITKHKNGCFISVMEINHCKSCYQRLMHTYKKVTLTSITTDEKNIRHITLILSSL